ncbi:MAG: hypothetical protein EAZ70_13155 [Runella slithyformis]|nr:MAG: hypothetical protein EAY79_10205 [Runella slithyformis]TAF94194.1 MAG: hypothetical protein EAZ46_10895 [Runella sp.]TAG18684.1 MAG: hypothetical protein EAZ38_14190 [Cytophagales bacterium]TAG38234.1 MAG: hypothetical protein EAZ32_13020 [Cytophagia bacterium]TAE96690.1 MAG: hypothetical protein EAZ80_08215 [Runella slithyformis]
MALSVFCKGFNGNKIRFFALFVEQRYYVMQYTQNNLIRTVGKLNEWKKNGICVFGQLPKCYFIKNSFIE